MLYIKTNQISNFIAYMAPERIDPSGGFQVDFNRIEPKISS